MLKTKIQSITFIRYDINFTWVKIIHIKVKSKGKKCISIQKLEKRIYEN